MSTEEVKTEQNEVPTQETPKTTLVVGVDLGTLNLIAAYKSDDELSSPTIIQNNLSNDVTPVIVSFKNSTDRTLGEEALNMYVSSPKSTVTQIKRFIGASVPDMHAELTKFAIKLITHNNDPHIQVQFNGNETMDLLPEQLLSMLMSKVHQYTLQHYCSHNKVSADSLEVKYVFAVPSSFTSAQLSSIKDSCKISGIHEVEFVSDISAAIINYVYFRGADKFKENPKKMMFLSMGHSYFTGQIVELKGNDMNVLSSVSSNNLGARNFDYALFDYAREEFKKKSGFDITSNPKSINRVLKACEKCKQVLSTINETDLIVEALHNDKDLHIKVNRQLFEDLNENSLKLLETNISKLLNDGSISDVDNQLDGVEVCGGGVRIPSVQNRIKSILKKDLLFGISAQAVALGASLYGKMKDEKFPFKLQVNEPFAAFEYINKVSEDKVTLLREKNMEFEEQEKLIASIHAKKNELESYVFMKKNQLNDNKYQSLVSSSQKESILTILRNAEDWIHTSDVDTLSPSEQLTTYTNKFEEVQKEVNNASDSLYQALLKEEEQKKKEMEEAAEFAKNYKPEKKEREEPRTKAEKMDAAAKKKHQGNVCFKDGDYENAVKRYTQAIGFLDSAFDLSPDQKKEVDEIKLSCYLNNAMAYMKLQVYDKCKFNAGEALKIDANNVKALFRRGQASYYLRDFESSSKDLSQALKVDPNNGEISRMLKTVNEQLAAQKEKEKTMYKKMFA